MEKMKIELRFELTRKGMGGGVEERDRALRAPGRACAKSLGGRECGDPRH